MVCMIWYGLVWFSTVWYGMVWYTTVWYSMVWCVGWHGLVWYGMECHVIVWHGISYESEVIGHVPCHMVSSCRTTLLKLLRAEVAAGDFLASMSASIREVFALAKRN